MPEITLTFSEEDLARIKLVCRRKNIDLATYILDNFEWDDSLPCLCIECLMNGKITDETCFGCDQSEHCPDAVKRGDLN